MKETVAVIGAGGGSGSALVKALLAAGKDVVGTVLNDAEEDVARAATPLIRRLVKVDLSNASNVGPGMTELLADPKLKRLGAVVVCAGISPFGPIEITPVERLRLVLEINTVSAVAIYQKSMPHLRRSKGRFVLTGSMAGKVGIPFIGYYSASKFALEALADVMRREAQQWDVNVAIIEPGSIKTPMVSEQIRQVEAGFARLGSGEKKLYGHMYKRWAEIVSQGFEAAFPPELFAAAAMRALTAKRPSSRYVSDPVGAAMINASRTLSDRQLDKFVQKMMGLTVTGGK